jgi:Methylmalonic aciduria and homocystinuria type D protein
LFICTFQFEDTARRVCGKLNQAGFWADFPTKIQFDMSSEESIDTSASQIEAANLLLSPGPRVIHISGCILMLHPPKGESRVLGWLFTTAPFDDAKLMDIIDDENA